MSGALSFVYGVSCEEVILERIAKAREQCVSLARSLSLGLAPQPLSLLTFASLYSALLSCPVLRLALQPLLLLTLASLRLARLLFFGVTTRLRRLGSGQSCPYATSALIPCLYLAIVRREVV